MSPPRCPAACRSTYRDGRGAGVAAPLLGVVGTVGAAAGEGGPLWPPPGTSTAAGRIRAAQARPRGINVVRPRKGEAIYLSVESTSTHTPSVRESGTTCRLCPLNRARTYPVGRCPTPSCWAAPPPRRLAPRLRAARGTRPRRSLGRSLGRWPSTHPLPCAGRRRPLRPCLLGACTGTHAHEHAQGQGQGQGQEQGQDTGSGTWRTVHAPATRWTWPCLSCINPPSSPAADAWPEVLPCRLGSPSPSPSRASRSAEPTPTEKVEARCGIAGEKGVAARSAQGHAGAAGLRVWSAFRVRGIARQARSIRSPGVRMTLGPMVCAPGSGPPACLLRPDSAAPT